MIVFILYPRVLLDTKSFPVSAADPGEGPGEPASPLIFGPRRIFFKTLPPPPSQGLDDLGPHNLKVWIHYRV